MSKNELPKPIKTLDVIIRVISGILVMPFLYFVLLVGIGYIALDNLGGVVAVLIGFSIWIAILIRWILYVRPDPAVSYDSILNETREIQRSRYRLFLFLKKISTLETKWWGCL
jgi:hypothetical protein